MGEGASSVSEARAGKGRRRRELRRARVIDPTLPWVLRRGYMLGETGRCQRCGRVGVLFDPEEALERGP